MTDSDADLAAAFRARWDRHFAPAEGEAVVVGASGGLDSMVLLALLARGRSAAERRGVVAAHYDHRTRGRASADDGRFVEAVGRRWGIEVVRGEGDAPARARRTGEGPQAAARALRYRFLARTAAERGAAIATAHHRDDRVETVVLRLVRGTSPDGLGALTPIGELDGRPLLRPLLAFGRRALEAWAEATGVPYRDDPSNRDPRYPRTVVRERILPAMAELNPRVADAVARLSAQAAADAAWFADEVETLLADATEARAGGVWRLRAAPLAAAPDPFLSRALVAGWAWSAPAGADAPNAAWVTAASAFVRRGRGGTVEGPGGGTVVRSGRWLEFRRPAREGDADG